MTTTAEARAAVMNAARETSPDDRGTFQSTLAWLAHDEQVAQEALNAAVAKFNEDATTNPEYAVKWKLDDVIETRVGFEFARNALSRAAEMVVLSTGDVDEAAIVAAAKRAAAENLIEFADIAKSSSALVSAMSTIEVQAKIKRASRILSGGW